jgi:CRISPR-associated protein Cas1
MARSVGRYQGNVLLRRAHHRIADSPKRSASIAHAIVVAKVLNSRTLLLRARREHPSDGNFDDAITQLDTIVRSNTEVASVDHLRAIEGDAARRYFQVFDHLILINKRDFYFKLRSRRPPLDRVNAMLSFVYTLLAHDMVSALECVGLDPAVGFLHADRPGRPSLALDVMEEFRPFLADRLVLSLINRQQVTGKGFSVTESGAVEMDEETRKTLISAFQNRKREEIEHPFLKEKIAIGLIPYTQALLLARHIRGDLDAYPPFIWK